MVVTAKCECHGAGPARECGSPRWTIPGQVWKVTALLHPLRPLQKPHQIAAVLPHEAPEFLEADLVGRGAPIRLHAPAQKRATPGTQAIASGSAPREKHQRGRVWLTVFLEESSGVA